MSDSGLHVVRIIQKQKELSWVALNCSVPGLFLSQGLLRGHQEVVPAEALWLKRSYDEADIFFEVKNLTTSLLIICQKEKFPVIFREDRHALRTCGSAVTQRFIPYCQLSCVLSSRRFKLYLFNM